MKFLLNTLWGKFAQRLDHVQTSFVKTHAGLLGLLTDDGITVQKIKLVGFTSAVVSYKPNIERLESHKFYNPCLAAFVTSNGKE